MKKIAAVLIHWCDKSEMRIGMFTNHKMDIGKIATCGVLASMAMIFSYIESFIPMPPIVPGIKLGLANIAIIAVLFCVGAKEAFLVNIIRISIISVLFGNINTFMFSMAGGLLSLSVMTLLKKFKIFSIIAISIAGGVFHNVGQIVAAVFIMDTSAIIYYLPVLIVGGVITGIIIGIVSGLVTERVMPAIKRKHS